MDLITEKIKKTSLSTKQDRFGKFISALALVLITAVVILIFGFVITRG